jgi:hypothetical protein
VNRVWDVRAGERGKREDRGRTTEDESKEGGKKSEPVVVDKIEEIAHSEQEGS